MWKSTFGKIVIRTVLFLVIFTGTALIVNMISNRGSRAAYVELRGTSLPVLFTCVEDTILSPVPAYQQDMDASLLRDAVVPLVEDDRTVTVYLDERNDVLQDVQYRLRNVTDGNLIEEGEPEVLDIQKDGMTGYRATLRMDLVRNREYTFELLASGLGGKQLHFYIRVIRLNRSRMGSFLTAAEDFHNLLLSEKNDQQKSTLTPYLQYTPDDVDPQDLGFVSLQSDYETLVWGELKPEMIGKRETSLSEISETCGTIVYRYRVCTTDEELSQLKYYDVEEHFSLEYTPEKDSSRVINYFRKVRESYQDADFDRNLNGLRFGIRDQQPVYLMSEDSEYLIFEADDSVWFYDYNASTITRIFGSEKSAFLYGTSQGTKPLYADEKEAWFAVYGRMDSGRHEGENGLLLQVFRKETRTIEEVVFLKTNISYPQLRMELEKMLYLDKSRGKLYYLMGQSLRSYSFDSQEESVLVDRLRDADLFTSDDSSVVAWPEQTEGLGVEKIQLRDLSTDHSVTIERKGKKLCPLAFVGTDFVYGAADPDRVRLAADGSAQYLFSNVYFVDRIGREEKNYQKSGVLISDVTFLSNTIYLTRVLETEGSWVTVEYTPDYISYKAEETRGKAILKNDSGQEGYSLIFPSGLYLTSVPEHLIARLSEDEGKILSVEGESVGDVGLLYRAGDLVETSSRIGSLVRDAVTLRGTVRTLDGSVLYRLRTGVPYLTVADQVDYIKADEAGADGYAECLSMCLQKAGVSATRDQVKQIAKSGTGSWEKAFADFSGGTVRGLNLSGADLETAILYLGDGIPFATKLEDRYVLVVSFNSDAIRFYDPIRGYEIRPDRNDFRRRVVASGNEFYLYAEE